MTPHCQAYRSSNASGINSQETAVHQDAIGSPPEKCTTAAITPAPAGIGMPTKYFLPGRPGFDGCGLAVMLKRARRLVPAIRNRKLAMAPNCPSLLNNWGDRTAGNWRKPQLQANIAGATPKVMTSASESSSLPKPLLVFVIRAIR